MSTQFSVKKFGKFFFYLLCVVSTVLVYFMDLLNKTANQVRVIIKKLLTDENLLSHR